MNTGLDIILIIAILTVPAIAQAFITVRYKKYSGIDNSQKLSGFETARKILDANGLSQMDIVAVPGSLTDHYDPSRKVVRLSQSNFNDNSIAAMAVAAHECGHAIQDKEGYFMMKLRSAIVPVVKIGTGVSYIIIAIAFLFEILQLFYIGIACSCLGLLFQLITLPVEFDASNRAGKQLSKLGLIDKNDKSGTKKVLGAAAMTYVAGMLSSLLVILRYVLMFSGRRD
ncbi:MAG: zinc metallopeptidase [Bacilli bacterium]|nr:zinc metallopeptidase [Bacilli bacterium]